MRWAGAWAAGTYAVNQVVQHEGGYWVCIAASGSTTDEPNVVSADWSTFGPLPGRGALTNSAPSAEFTLTVLWTPIDNLDSIGLPAYGTTLDTVGSRFRLDFVGLWQITVQVFFSHDSSNSGRTTGLRLFNETDAVGGATVPVGIGRNVTETNVSLTLTTQIPQADVGDVFRIELGGLDTINNVVVTDVGLTLIQLGVA